MVSYPCLIVYAFDFRSGPPGHDKMRSFGNVALALLSAASIAAASDVHTLTKDTFDSFIKENELVLAKFYAPWCGHCKALAPEYEEAATALKDKKIHLVKVDCTEEADLCQKHGVEGYPTLKVFRGSDIVAPYSGQRKSQAIVSHMTKQSMPAISRLEKDSIEEFKTADKVVLIGYYGKDDKASDETFTAVANGLRDSFLFGTTDDKELAKAEGVTQPSIVLYKAFDEGKDVFKEKFEKEAIEQFAKTAAVPLIGEIGPETYSGYMAAGIPLAYIFAETEEERKKLADELRPVATKHKGKVNIATIDAEAFGQHAANLNLEVGKWPAFAIQDTESNKKYPYPQEMEINQKAIGEFLDNFVAGKIEPSIKSEPVPEKQDGPVTVIVAHNYNEIVMDDEKDVLVEFYAPWCGHCKALAPKYDELGEMYSQNEEFKKLVTVAKVDATANDVPEEIQGFPTIKLFPAGKKGEPPIDYSGARTVEDLANFIRDKGTHKVDVLAAKNADKEASDKSDDASTAKGKVKEAVESVKESVKSKAGEAAEAAKAAIIDDADNEEGHDEL